MSFRNKLKRVKNPDLPLGEYLANEVQWTCGPDVPLSWSAKDLKQCEKNCLRANFKNGYFTKKQYKKALKKMNKYYKRKCNEKNANIM
jgi:hypothetical protein